MLITWHIVKLILWLIVLFNAIAALITVFREKRDIAATWAWLLVLTLLPVIGFIIYSFLGRKLPQRQLERIQTETQLELSEAFNRQREQFLLTPQPEEPTLRTYLRTIMLFQSIDSAFLSQHNTVELFNNGDQLFEKLLADIEAAKRVSILSFIQFIMIKLVMNYGRFWNKRRPRALKSEFYMILGVRWGSNQVFMMDCAKMEAMQGRSC